MKFTKILIFVVTIIFVSCGTTEKVSQPLYNWGLNYNKYSSTYDVDLSFYYGHESSTYAKTRLFNDYYYMITAPGGERQVVPPGIYAEFATYGDELSINNNTEIDQEATKQDAKEYKLFIPEMTSKELIKFREESEKMSSALQEAAKKTEESFKENILSIYGLEFEITDTITSDFLKVQLLDKEVELYPESSKLVELLKEQIFKKYKTIDEMPPILKKYLVSKGIKATMKVNKITKNLLQ